MEIRYIDSNDDLKEISRIYEQSWKYAYKGIIPLILFELQKKKIFFKNLLTI